MTGARPMSLRSAAMAPSPAPPPRRLAFAALALTAALWAVSPAPAWAAPESTPHEPTPSEPHSDEEHHGESPLAFASRIANFVILFGGLYYVLRSPMAKYLAGRSDQIRKDLVDAERTRSEAAAQLAAIEARMKQLPADIEQLRAQGKADVATEDARLRAAAEHERTRMLDLSRREIDAHLRQARRELTEHAATLAVGLARDRIVREAGPADQRRLIDRYLSQVQTTP